MYFPKSQVKTNLYTNGEEFVLSTNKSKYVGYYWTNSSGKYYSGKTPDDRPNIELIHISSVSQNTSTIPGSNTNLKINVLSLDNTAFLDSQYGVKYNNAFVYTELKNINTYDIFPTLIPYYSPVTPTQQDYQNGEFRRFFCKKTNEVLYIEINQEQFSKLISKNPQIEWSLYQPFNIPWKLTGDKEQVFKTNKNIVELTSLRQKLPRFADYLRFNFTQYYQS